MSDRDTQESNQATSRGRLQTLRDRYGGRSQGSRAKPELTGPQKAAVFLISLGTEVSAHIFEHLTEEEIEGLTLEVARMENVDSGIKGSVLKEFHELFVAHRHIDKGGIEYAQELLEKSIGSEKAAGIISRLTQNIRARPFEIIRNTDPTHLLNFIQQEHPQTIALILAHLEPHRASLVLSSLSNEIRSDVSRRIAIMDRTSPEVLREVERVLERKLSSLSSENYTSSGGISTIVDILNLVDRSTEKSIIESLEDEDPELAEEIKKRMFVFEDIVMLDDQAIQKVLRETDSAELAKALKGIDSEVQEKIFKNISRRAGTLLQEDMEYIGPIRLKDVEEAQQKIVNVIRVLEERGEIIIARAGEDELIV